MPSNPPVIRSRLKQSRLNGWYHDERDNAYVPAPLNVRKPNTPGAPVMQRFDPASIGLAVGSPNHSPLPPSPDQNLDNTNAFNFRALSPARPRANTDQSGKERKAKGTKWKTLGGLWSKRDSRDTASQAEGPLCPVNLAIQREWQYVPNKPNAASRKRAGSDKEKTIDLQSSRASKEITRKQSLLRRVSSKHKGARRKPATNSTPQRLRNSIFKTHRPPHQRENADRRSVLHDSQGRSRLLQVEIPDIQMERYSVMFCNVLQPGFGELATSKTALTKSRQGRGEDDQTEIIPPEPVCPVSPC